MTMPKYVSIEGIKFSPQSLTCSIQDIDYDAGRTADGTMHRNKVTRKLKYQISLAPMHTGEYLYTGEENDIVDLLNQLENETFTAEMPDPFNSGALTSRRYYVGDRSLPIHNFTLDLWDSISFDIVEV